MKRPRIADRFITLVWRITNPYYESARTISCPETICWIAKFYKKEAPCTLWTASLMEEFANAGKENVFPVKIPHKWFRYTIRYIIDVDWIESRGHTIQADFRDWSPETCSTVFKDLMHIWQFVKRNENII